MAGENQDTLWPVSKFHFKVTFRDMGEMSFQEVSGLDTQYDVIEYRAGNSIDFSTVKMPGLRKASDVTLKRGLFKATPKLMDFFQSVKMNTIKRETIIIQLLDEEQTPLSVWSLKKAWPLQMTELDLNAESGEVAIERLVLTHEGITFEKA